MKTTNKVPEDSYFIRLSDKPSFFLHPKTDNNKVLEYQALEGPKGAAVWHKKQGEQILLHAPQKNLELVPVSEVLKQESV